MILSKLHEWLFRYPALPSEKESSASGFLQKCLDPLRHDRMTAHKVQNEDEKAACLMAVRDIVLDIDLLIQVLADDQCEHRLDSADPDQMLCHTVAAVFSGTGKCGRQDRYIVRKKNTQLI